MNYFFILGIGRSGTTFLANILNKAKNAFVGHEDKNKDFQILPLSYYSDNKDVINSLLVERFKEIHKNIPSKIKIYGEVNSLLRYNIDYLENEFSPKLLHIIRDGREFVRSAYSRNIYTGFDSHLPILPKLSDKFSKQWNDFSRFQKICWYWNSTNSYLSERINKYVRFEDIISDYTFLKVNVVEYLGLEINDSFYTNSKNQKKNSTKKYLLKKNIKKIFIKDPVRRQVIPKWTEWGSKMTDQFWEICEESMNKFNYH